VSGDSPGGVAHATGAGCSVGVAASEGAGIGANDSVGMANCSVMQGHDGPLYTSSQPVRNMPTSSVVDTGHSTSESQEASATSGCDKAVSDSDAAEPSRNRRSRHLYILYDKLLIVLFD
jgi:hypothetical protein